MKIWKAELILFYTMEDKYDIKFEFKEQEKDYKFNDSTKDEWIYSEGWISNRIPTNMTIESSSYSAIKVVQGFDHELTKEELKQLEKDMKQALIEKLEHDKEIYLKQYEDKLKIIQG